ncbi:hypothetical protein CA236_01185 [Sphingomonas sp. ABOLG]|nr:hypothetical protein CA236_01185 [Sphingomonas sp. ABOLG]
MIRGALVGAVVVLLLIGGLGFLWQRADARADRLALEVREAGAEADRLKKRNDQLERAALERLADDRAVDQLGKDMHDAIKDIPGGTAPSPAAVALGCQRLRAAGATASGTFQRVCGGR